MATRYKLAPENKLEKYKIGDDHFTPREYEHIVEVTLKVYQCKFVIDHSDNQGIEHGINTWTMQRRYDVSEHVVDYNCSYTDGDNICQSASVTFKVPTDNANMWYAPRETMTEYHSNVEGTADRYGTDWAYYYYELVKVYKYPNSNKEFELRLGYFKVTNSGYNTDSTTGTVSLSLSGLSCTLQPEYGGNSNRSYATKEIEIYVYHKDYQGKVTKTKEKKQIKVMLSPYIPQNTYLSEDLVYNHIMGSWANADNVVDLGTITPAVGVWIDNNGQMIETLYQEKEFDADCSRADVINHIVDSLYVGGRYWIDENCYFRIRGKQELRKSLVMKWKDYSNLFISESISYNDSGYYNTSIARGEITMDGGTIPTLGYFEESDAVESQGYRVQYINNKSLQSDDECEDLAAFETYKAMWGKESVTVELQDAYIPEFRYPSLCVGKTIEYKTTFGYTTDFTINQIKFGDSKITLDLTPFKPLYPVEHSKTVQDNTLGTPIITHHEVKEIDGKYYVRLYIEGDDVDYGFVKIYQAATIFTTEGGTISGENAKFVDVPVEQNGDYKFYAQICSPYFEPSGWSGDEYRERVAYDVTVDSVMIPAITEDPDPYPHPNMFEPTDAHEPYIVTQNNNPLTTEGGIIITG